MSADSAGGGDAVGDATDGAASGGSDPDSGGDEDPVDEQCSSDSALLPTLRFLTREEYDNTIRDIFGERLDVTAAFPADEATGGFRGNSTQAPSSTQLQLFFDTAQSLATEAAGPRLSQFVACQPADPGCSDQFIAEFGRRAFRRPLTDEETATFAADFVAIESEQGAEAGLEVVAASMLASPHFLYIGGRSDAADPKVRAYDLASRLSYFVWATMPDESLLQAAESETLLERSQLESQIRRMLEDERASDMLTSFSTQWLEVDTLGGHPKSGELFPQWTPELATAAERETADLMRDVVLDGDATVASLLTSRRAYVDSELAAVYGVEVPEGGEGWVELPAEERAGMLTRTAFLARHSHATENSWVHRGKVVRERLLCGKLPPPPPVADDSPINDNSRLEDPSCAGCHQLMDPIGFGFDGYDPIGRFEGGSHPGAVNGLEEPDFDGALELSQRLAQSDEVELCFAKQMYGYAHRREINEDDTCAVEALAEAFVETDGDIVELIVLLATADAFTGQGNDQ